MDKIAERKIERFHILKCDFHVHFTEAYGSDARPMIDAFHQARYDCIALTDHADLLKDLSSEKEAQIYARKRYGSDFLVITGLEISLNDEVSSDAMRHLVALFIEKHINPPRETDLEASLITTLDRIHRQKGLGIIVHDHRGVARLYEKGVEYPEWIWDYRKGKAIDGYEIGNGSGYYERSPYGSNCMLSHPQESIDEGYITLAGSDAHDVQQIADRSVCCTYVFTLDKTIEAVKEALLARRTLSYCNGILYGQERWFNIVKTGGEKCHKVKSLFG